MPRGTRFEWQHGRPDPRAITDGPWVCDCPDYGLKPKPSRIGECQTCYRPVYDDDWKRVTGEHISAT